MIARNVPAKKVAVFGIYPSSFDAEGGAADLISAGYSSRDISVLLLDVRSLKASAGTTAGVTAGGILEGALGILTGVGAVVIPGVGPILAAGPIHAGLPSLGAAGGVGGLVGTLQGFGISEYEALRYEGRVTDGGTLLSVHCTSPAQVKRAKQILNSSGADHVVASSESRSERAELAVT